MTKARVEQLIKATNAFDVDAALALFAPRAVIEDVSVGETFSGKAGVRRYLEQFFAGYHTVSTVLSIESADDLHADAHLDFTGDFGHETGWLKLTFDAGGRIARIDADLDPR